MHHKMMAYFHEYRTSKTDDIFVQISGSDFNRIVVKAKTDTYDKYPKQIYSKIY